MGAGARAGGAGVVDHDLATIWAGVVDRDLATIRAGVFGHDLATIWADVVDHDPAMIGVKRCCRAGPCSVQRRVRGSHLLSGAVAETSWGGCCLTIPRMSRRGRPDGHLGEKWGVQRRSENGSQPGAGAQEGKAAGAEWCSSVLASDASLVLTLSSLPCPRGPCAAERTYDPAGTLFVMHLERLGNDNYCASVIGKINFFSAAAQR